MTEERDKRQDLWRIMHRVRAGDQVPEDDMRLAESLLDHQSPETLSYACFIILACSESKASRTHALDRLEELCGVELHLAHGLTVLEAMKRIPDPLPAVFRMFVLKCSRAMREHDYALRIMAVPLLLRLAAWGDRESRSQLRRMTKDENPYVRIQVKAVLKHL